MYPLFIGKNAKKLRGRIYHLVHHSCSCNIESEYDVNEVDVVATLLMDKPPVQLQLPHCNFSAKPAPRPTKKGGMVAKC